MPTYYVEDYDGEKNDDAVERVTLTPVSDLEAKVVTAEHGKREPHKSSRAQTKG